MYKVSNSYVSLFVLIKYWFLKCLIYFLFKCITFIFIKKVQINKNVLKL